MKQSKKELIMAIAFDLFVEKGYENTNIRQICKEASVEPPTLYYYFESKKGLFCSIVERMAEKYNRMLNEMDLHDHNMEPENILFELLRFNLHYARSYPKEMKFLVRYKLFPPEEIVEDLMEIQNKAFVCLNKIETNAFEECVRKGLIENDRVDFVRKIYDMFTSNHCYDTVMFDYSPSDEELTDIWNYFLKYKIMSVSE